MTVPYWRLSGFYLFFFATLGALLPYWSVYLRDLGYSPGEIGSLMAIIAGTKIIAPNLWGWVADRRGERMPVVRFGAGQAAGSFGAGILWGTFGGAVTFWAGGAVAAAAFAVAAIGLREVRD